MGDLGDDLQYLSGFGNELWSEAVPGSLPRDQNAPQRCPQGLVAEQLSGSAFTMARRQNLRTWLYRTRPSVLHGRYERIDAGRLATAPIARPADPNQLRWDPPALPAGPVDWLDSLATLVVNGDAGAFTGCGVHLYAATADMARRCFYSADGHLLIVPQQGRLDVWTELGRLVAKPGEIVLIPRGIKLSVALPDGAGCGYVCECYGAPFELPSLGPIGANGLASARHFLAPVAAPRAEDGPWQMIGKLQGNLWAAPLARSPFDVVAWHGNYLPNKYDLARFQAVNAVDYDHSDPSIFTVLTSPSPVPGTANVDFVIFPPRWVVAEHTFRPPYYHRNVMSEFMGLIHGVYDAKAAGAGGFVPGGASLHNCMSAHGPDAATFAAASSAELKPVFQGGTLAFMVESNLPFAATDFAHEGGLLQADYLACWAGLAELLDK